MANMDNTVEVTVNAKVDFKEEAKARILRVFLGRKMVAFLLLFSVSVWFSVIHFFTAADFMTFNQWNVTALFLSNIAEHATGNSTFKFFNKNNPVKTGNGE